MDSVVAQLRAGGASEKAIDELVKRELSECEDYEVYRENWSAVELFLRLSTQWRREFVAMGGNIWLGLDYAATVAYLDVMQVEDRKEVFLKFQILEASAKSVLNAKR